ncbi:MAG: hypothetical protein AVDCRST_MAG89-1190 [uncultured Gemmatimonadetes bacterium]|uniref:Uncharacterized protein n=1 Tax=uncultured Gemmatimonadota bacterium TaxID=203437 RepID=A0A6J4KR10_9BACT|nr:MAG: hypothetical protein AVDCRST_MAG89-1190 [uncultured Gemmatimonadota bacterium]
MRGERLERHRSGRARRAGKWLPARLLLAHRRGCIHILLATRSGPTPPQPLSIGRAIPRRHAPHRRACRLPASPVHRRVLRHAQCRGRRRARRGHGARPRGPGRGPLRHR